MTTNRPIKFRAWDKTRNRMIAVPIINFGEDGAALTVTVWDKTIEGFDNMYVVGESCELMQFTDLLDKNGKEIYEGDIVKRHDGRVGAVKFNHGCFVIAVAGVKALKKLGNKDDQHECEVIGNIYENPELLS